MLKEFANYSANNGLLEVAIREACQRGAMNFDFGASGELESVRKFKEQFGAAPVAYQSLRLQSNRYKLAAGIREKLVSLSKHLRPVESDVEGV
jgi:lipid II:glycine glycyltransferase (peptidoglycan interpeptide bridge formation enzyme)